MGNTYISKSTLIRFMTSKSPHGKSLVPKLSHQMSQSPPTLNLRGLSTKTPHNLNTV